MEMCDDGHAQICHDERTCPLCEKEDEMKEAIKEAEKVANDKGYDVGYDAGISDA